MNDDTYKSGQAVEVSAGDFDHFSLYNTNEELVRASVRDLQPKMDMCCCSKCYFDACAIALNNLPPKYVTTYKGEVYSRIPQLHSGSRAEVAIIVARALKQVKESPSHG